MLHPFLACPLRLCYDGSMTQLKKFPIGMQDFADIRKDGYYYVDKTSFAHGKKNTR